MHSLAVAQVGGTSTCKFWWKHDMIAALVFYFALLSRVSDAIPSDCQEKWFMQRLDHFHWQKGSQPTFPQRYIVCDRANWTTTQPKGPIFFYCKLRCVHTSPKRSSTAQVYIFLIQSGDPSMACPTRARLIGFHAAQVVMRARWRATLMPPA